MKKWTKLVALLLALLMLGGCNLIAVDPELDAQTTIAQVGDEVITKGEATSAINMALAQEAYYYQMFGMSFDATNEDIVGPIRENTVDSLVDEKVIAQKAKELSLDTFTDEEMAEIEAEALTSWQSDYDYVAALPEFSDAEETDTGVELEEVIADEPLNEEETEAPEEVDAPEATDEPDEAEATDAPEEAADEAEVTDEPEETVGEAEATDAPEETGEETSEEEAQTYDDEAVLAYLDEYGMTIEEYVESLKASDVRERIREYAIADVEVTEEEEREVYNTNLEEQKEKYVGENGSLSSFASDLMNGTEIYFIPSGMRYIKHVLIKISDEDSTRISELETSLAENETARISLEEQITDTEHLLSDEAEEDEHDHSELTDEDKAALETQLADLNTQLDALKEAYDQQQTELADLQESAYAAILPTAQEVYEKAVAGEDFDELVAAYGEDPGMTQEPYITTGYPVAEGMTTYETPFQDTAMALVKTGDISEPVKASNGYHILKYEADSVEQETSFEDVREGIHDSLLTTKQDEVYDEALAQWRTDAKVKIYLDRLK